VTSQSVSGPVLTTNRLELWQPQASDLADLFELTRDDETRKFLGGFEPSHSDSFARLYRNAGSWAFHGYGVFMVRFKDAPRIVGSCGIFRSHRGFGAQAGLDDVAEAGWIVHRDHWGNGLAREAMEAALAWFDATHGRQRIACMIEEGHAASDKLARQLGFESYGRHEPDEGAVLVLYSRS
jgi:RimJ/RimL family protein N-acetyltransferase